MDTRSIGNDLMVSSPGIAPCHDPAIDYQAALYFLEGQYLFRVREGEGWSAKFVTAPDLAAAFSRTEVDTGWFPAGVVRTGINAKGPWYVYSAPAQKVKIVLAGQEIEIPIPRTLLVGVGANYYLFALKSAHFDPGDRLYKAPFPNLYDDGRVCWGQNTPGPTAVQKARSVWELFFSTPFNTDLATDKSQSNRTNVSEKLRQVADDRLRNFPASDLVESHSGRMAYQVVDGLIS